jgi:hypothetical protein
MRPPRTSPGDEPARLQHDFFYRDGTPDVARELLLRYLQTELPELSRAVEVAESRDEAARRLLLRTLFFVRAAEKRPALRRVYEEVARAAAAAELWGLFPILMHVGDEATAEVLAGLADRLGLARASLALRPDRRLERARAPISEPEHVDLRWVEFMASGDIGKVIEIVGVLGGADRFRSHLEALLRPAKRLMTRFSEDQDRRAQIVAGLQPLGLRFAPHTHEIKNPDDLDVLITVDGVELAPQRLATAESALPAPLPESLTLHARTKAAALHSLASHAVEHAPVLAVCEGAAAKLTGAVRLTLLRLLVEVHAARADLPAARSAMRLLLEGNRVREDLRARAAALLQAEPPKAE